MPAMESPSFDLVLDGLFQTLQRQADSFDDAFVAWRPWQLVLGTAAAVYFGHVATRIVLVQWNSGSNFQGDQPLKIVTGLDCPALSE